MSWVSAALVEPLERRTLFASGLPRPDHVVIAIEENHSHEQIIGSKDAPYINALAAQGASFTDYSAITNPSQPNYIALFSGSTHGVVDNDIVWTIDAPSLGGQLISAGFDFGGYSEDLPYTGFSFPAFRYYHRRHNPWVDFRDVPWTDNLPFRTFPRPGSYNRLPTVSFVVPNLLNDMHNGTVQQADDWLREKLDPYVQWAKAHNSLFVLTWDEDDLVSNNRIPTIVVGAGVKPGNYSQPLTHYSLLRTIEDMYGLPYLGNAATAAPYPDIWEPPAEKTTRLAPTADTFAWDEAPTRSFGTGVLLDVKTSGNVGQNSDTYLKFDVRDVPTSGVESIRLRYYGALSGRGRVSTGVFAVADTGWTETSVTWKNKPKMGNLLGTTTAASTQYGWFEVDVTSYVRAQRQAGRATISLGLHNPKRTTPRFRIHSREAADFRPELVVVKA
jgi:phosphatidylinositol-3-phosphatase